MSSKKIDDTWFKDKIHDDKVFFTNPREIFNGEHLPINIELNIKNTKNGDGYGKFINDGDAYYIFYIKINKDGKGEVQCRKLDRFSLMADHKDLDFTDEEMDYFKNSKVFRNLCLQFVDKMFNDAPRMSGKNEIEKYSRGREKVKEFFDNTLKPQNFKAFK